MQLGTMIAGRYRLDGALAAGGMGEVWRGTDMRLNRVVAVKLLHSGLSSNDRFRARFHQEAQAVAALQAPGIVALYDYGEESGPEGVVSYLIMELVQGQSLANVIHQRRRLSPTEVLKIVATAAEALDVAHRAHIVHRDVKPANLLVGEDGSVKIVDFGIASARGQAGLTETGTVMGTLSYASPEQLAGGELTGATDVYSLGIVAYECLAGRTPFNGNDPAALITAHMTGQPAPLPPDVPAPIAQIVMRCLAKDPRQRFGSAAELAQACRTGRPGSGTTAILAPGSPPTQAMGQTMVQPATQPIDQFGSDRPPTGTLPPPRDFEEPERSKTVPIVATVAGVLVLLIALVFLVPWGADDKDPPDRAASTTGAGEPADVDEPASDDGAEETAEEEVEAEEDAEEPEEEAAEETTESAPEEPTSAELPDLREQPVTDAIWTLDEIGFTNVRTVPQQTTEDGEAPPVESLCMVAEQDPPGDGTTHELSQLITVYYWDSPEADCGT